MRAEKQKKSKTVKLPKHLQHINIHAAGIDVGSRSHFMKCRKGRANHRYGNSRVSPMICNAWPID